MTMIIPGYPDPRTEKASAKYHLINSDRALEQIRNLKDTHLLDIFTNVIEILKQAPIQYHFTQSKENQEIFIALPRLKFGQGANAFLTRIMEERNDKYEAKLVGLTSQLAGIRMNKVES